LLDRHEPKSIGSRDDRVSMADTHMSNDLFKNLAHKLEYLSDQNLKQVESAFLFAETAHKDQKRLSGEPYIIHPVTVASYLADKKYDVDILTAALLHDVLEDSNFTFDQLKSKFGTDVAKIVLSVTSISKIPLRDKSLIFSDENMYLDRVEEYRKLLVAMAKEIRVIVIKLADRLHNAQTIQFLPAFKQPFYARETIEIFAQIADRLGLNAIKLELEDLSFPYAYPSEYQNFKQITGDSKNIKPKLIEEKILEIKQLLNDNKIKYSDIYGRVKHDFSLYRKLKYEKNFDFSAVYDLYALRIITDNVESCYKILGLVHSIYSPVSGRIYDYIAEPKANGYQSIHSTIRDKNSNVLEIQIRTEEMHCVAESGMAAHWRYETGINEKAASRLKQSFNDWTAEVEKLNRIKNKQKILTYLKEDLFADKIFIFTPSREIIKLPKGSTPIDFAFRIHSSLGLHISAAKINGRLVPIYSELQNADEIEITTKNSAAPSIDWLRHTKTSAAKQKIRQHLRSKNRDQYINIGHQILDQFVIKHNLKMPTVKELNSAVSDSRLPYKNFEEALVGLAEKALPVSSLAKTVFPSLSLTEKKSTNKKEVLDSHKKLAGIKNIYARCCKPIKSDKLTAYVGQDHLIKIHKSTCGMIKNVNPERLIEL